MLTSVAHEPFLLRLPPGRFCSSNRISPSCLGEPTLKSRPAILWISCSSSAIRFSNSADKCFRRGASILMPAVSMPSRTGISGRSIVSYRPTMCSVARRGLNRAHSCRVTSASSAA